MIEEKIKNYIVSIKKDIESGKILQKEAHCELDEGFYIGFRAGLNNAIFNLERILNDE